MSVLLLEGPAGGGKSAEAARLLADGDADVLVDFTALYAALSGATRDPTTGKYPPRPDGDPLVPLVNLVKATAIEAAAARGFRVVATTSRREDDVPERAAQRAGVPFRKRTIDPGEDVVISRLTDEITEALEPECRSAASRWFGDRVSTGGSGRDVTGAAVSSTREYWRSASGRLYPVTSRR